MKQLVKELDWLKDTLNKVALEVQSPSLLKKSLKESIQASHHFQKKLEEEVPTLKDDIVETSNVTLKEQMSEWFFPTLLWT